MGANGELWLDYHMKSSRGSSTLDDNERASCFRGGMHNFYCSRNLRPQFGAEDLQ